MSTAASESSASLRSPQEQLRKEGTEMARLVVVSESEDTIAAPGNRRLNYLVVSVTNSDGVPVPRLRKSDRMSQLRM